MILSRYFWNGFLEHQKGKTWPDSKQISNTYQTDRRTSSNLTSAGGRKVCELLCREHFPPKSLRLLLWPKLGSPFLTMCRYWTIWNIWNIWNMDFSPDHHHHHRPSGLHRGCVFVNMVKTTAEHFSNVAETTAALSSAGESGMSVGCLCGNLKWL